MPELLGRCQIKRAVANWGIREDAQVSLHCDPSWPSNYILVSCHHLHLPVVPPCQPRRILQHSLGSRNRHWCCHLVNDAAPTFRAATLQSSSNSPTFPGISHARINIYAYHLYLTVLGLCLLCDYRNCSTGSMPQASHNFPDFLLTNVKLPDFSRFSTWAAT